MPDKKLGIKQRAVMLVLLAEARPISNPELKTLAGFVLDGRERRDLNARKLVDSRKVGRPFVHELTEDGRKWCADELSAQRPDRAGSAAGALYALLAGLGRFLAGSGLRLSDVFKPADKPTPELVELEDRIRAAYRRLAKEPGGWVGLTELRRLLDGARRSDVDDMLRRMNRTPQVSIVPEDNQKILTEADRAAAIRIGGQEKHLLSIGEV